MGATNLVVVICVQSSRVTFLVFNIRDAVVNITRPATIASAVDVTCQVVLRVVDITEVTTRVDVLNIT